MKRFSRENSIEIRRYIEKRKLKKKSDEVIAKELGKSRTAIIWWRKQLGIKSEHNARKLFKTRACICKILNQEEPLECLLDKDIQKKLKENSINLCRTSILQCRRELKIPPAESWGGCLTRQELYFKEGRVIWSPNGKHIFSKNKESIWRSV